MNKILVTLIVCLFVSWKALAEETSIEKLCRVNLEVIKELVEYPLDTLKNSEKAMNSIASLSEYEASTGSKTGSMVNTIKKYRKVSDHEAEAIVLKMYKDMELIKIRRAIEIKTFIGKINWMQEYESCVVASNAAIEQTNSKSVKP